MAAVEPAPPQGWRLWWLAARPRTLPLAAAPVVVGTAVAFAEGGLRPGVALAALGTALWLQIGANLANDVFDAERGADGEDRLGPARAVSSGWLTAGEMRAATALAFAAAAACGSALIAVGGWPIAALGALSIAAGLAYTGGPYPLGYHGLGDLAVFLFFGLVAVCGTAWLQLGALPAAAWLAALPVGALATAVLVVNNVRDAPTDAAAGKRTVAVRFGERAGRLEYLALVALSFAVPLLWAAASGRLALLLPLLCGVRAVRLCTAVWRDRGAALNASLGGTATLALAFAGLLAVGLVLPW